MAYNINWCHPTDFTSVYPHTPLTPSTTYYYRLEAVKSGIAGALSNEVSATPQSTTPEVTGISPSSGIANGGTIVTITGSGFVSGATVSSGGVNATGVTFGSATSLTATTPAAGSTGARNVVVTNPDGQTGTLAGGYTYTPAICAGDCYLEGVSPNFAQDLAIGTERRGPGGVPMSLQYANGSSGFKIWKEKNGNRILNASGYTSRSWQRKLIRAGTEFVIPTSSDSFFTTSTNIAGRVCPPHVFLSHSDMTATNRCLYYDSGSAAPEPLDSAGTAGVEATDWLQDWNRPATGRGTGSSYYEGNIKTCADKGMRLPTLYETTISQSDFEGAANLLPSGDIGVSPTAAGNSGIPAPAVGQDLWTASALSELVVEQNDHYFTKNDFDINVSPFNWTTVTVKCVLPNNPY